MEEMTMQEQRARFLEKFIGCRKALSAVGDETRQLIICTLIEHGQRHGMRVGEIQKYTNLSRTAVSHHLAVLKKADIIAMRKEGTKNFYYLDADSSSMKKIVEFWKEAEQMMAFCPFRSIKEEMEEK